MDVYKVSIGDSQHCHYVVADRDQQARTIATILEDYKKFRPSAFTVKSESAMKPEVLGSLISYFNELAKSSQPATENDLGHLVKLCALLTQAECEKAILSHGTVSGSDFMVEGLRNVYSV